MLKDKVVVVTGAVSGVGLAMAEMFAAEETKVLMVDINEERLKTQSERLGGLAWFKADLSVREDNKAAIDYAADWFTPGSG